MTRELWRRIVWMRVALLALAVVNLVLTVVKTGGWRIIHLVVGLVALTIFVVRVERGER